MTRNIAIALLAIFVSNFIFTITPHVSVLGPQAAWAEQDLSKRDYDSETQPASKEARRGIAGFWDKTVNFCEAVYDAIARFLQSTQESIQAMFGFENGEGPQAIFGGAFYLFLLLVALFVGKFLFNIVRDGIKGISGNNTPHSDRYRKPAFRNKN